MASCGALATGSLANQGLPFLFLFFVFGPLARAFWARFMITILVSFDARGQELKTTPTHPKL
jgi:hypothetical protein